MSSSLARAVPRWFWSSLLCRKALRRQEASLLRRVPLCDVPAAVFNTKPAPRVTQRRRTCALCLWGGGAARKLATRARRGALIVHGKRFVEGRRAGERHLYFGVRPWYDVRAAASNAKPAPRVLRGAGAPALCLWGGGAARKLAARARRAALEVVKLRPVKGHRTGVRPLSFDARS